MKLSDRPLKPGRHWVAPQATATEVADSVVTTWQEIQSVLSPVIGVRGVTVLYERSLRLAAASVPWLAGVPRCSQTEMDLAALRAALLERGIADAAQVGNALFLACQGLLAGLLGATLADRLLGAVWTGSSDSPPGSSAQASP